MTAYAQRRFDAIDVLRGLVIVLMTVDHASGAFNAGRFMQDGAIFWKAGSALPTLQFLLRWLTHVCAPTFVFLAGTSIALSSRSRAARGESEGSIDAALFKRGAFVALVDPLWMSLAFIAFKGIIFQVMYVLGVSMMLMAPLRKLSPRALLAGALLFSVLGEVASDLAVQASGGKASVPVALLLSAGTFPIDVGPAKIWIIAYPLLPWLTLMVLGYVFGQRLLDAPSSSTWPRRLALAGIVLLALFLVVRGIDGYGNMHLHRDSLDALQWLHVSKYPPSLTYVALELGIAALLLGWFFRAVESGKVGVLAPLRTLGQTSLFFYLLHAHLLGGAAHALGMARQGGLVTTLLAAAIALAVLYPLCVRYRAYKATHPDGLARYV